MKIHRKSTVTIDLFFYYGRMAKRMKDFLKALAIVMVFVTILMIVPFSEGCAPVTTNGVKDNEGLIVYKYVNLRSEPNTDSKKNIICQINFGETVDVLDKGDEWSKVQYGDKKGYIINESVSTDYVLIDLSDFNWGSEYKSIEQFKAFIERAQGSVKFVGCYIQVQRSQKENAHWKELTACLDEMGVPYGLYLYSGATTKDGAKKEYEKFLERIEGVELKNKIYPLMVDLEAKGNQSAVIEYYNDKVDDYIVYANASDMYGYGYYKMVEQYWIAHYNLCKVLPTKDYTEYKDAKTALADAALWQVTSKGNDVLFGTSHLDVNVVSAEWYARYAQ